MSNQQHSAFTENIVETITESLEEMKTKIIAYYDFVEYLSKEQNELLKKLRDAIK